MPARRAGCWRGDQSREEYWRSLLLFRSGYLIDFAPTVREQQVSPELRVLSLAFVM